MRFVSLDMRAGLQAQATDQIPVLLVTITHPDLAEPLYLSSDPTEKISIEPLVWGTRSGGNVFIHVIRGITLPDDRSPSQKAELVLNDIGGHLARQARSVASNAIAEMAIVRASKPDVIEIALGDLYIASATWEPGSIHLELADLDDNEPVPCDVMGKHNFPGLHP